jgi:4-aminobutyrate aminotransferase-like enzyme
MKRIVSTEGAYLIDEDGNRILDAISSWWVITHGHRHPVIMEAIRRATDAYDQIIFAEFTHEPAERLAKGVARNCTQGSESRLLLRQRLDLGRGGAQNGARVFPQQGRAFPEPDRRDGARLSR